MDNGKTILKTKGIVKRFPGVIALKGIDFDLQEGEVHALVGQNGAGKSTFLRTINGIIQPDEGEIFVDGKPVRIDSPLTARKLGITLVNQELTLLPNLSVMENIYLLGLAGEIQLLEKVDYNEMYKLAKEALEEVRLNIDPMTPLRELSAGEQQLVQIASALVFDARMICLDEPTSMLSPAEVKNLFETIKELKKKGKTMIFVSHKIDEVMEISDRITVFRDGQKIGTVNKEEITPKELIHLMLGESLEEFYVKRTKTRKIEAEVPLLEVRDIYTQPQSGTEVPLKGVSFKLYPGEVLGVTGLLGAGKTEIAKAIIGVGRVVKGEILIENRPTKIKSPADALRHGIFYLPEDRLHEGLVLQMTVKDNIVLPTLPRLSRFGIFTNEDAEREVAEKYVRELNIVTPSIYTKVDNLSGGNKQKVLVSRGLNVKPKILIIDEPTVGIDIGAKVEIRKLIKWLAEEENQTIMLISNDVDEVLSLADRVMVVNNGRVLAILENKELTREDIIHIIAEDNATNN